MATDAIEWLAADGEQVVPGRFDLITASSVFQWFTQAPTGLPTLLGTPEPRVGCWPLPLWAR